MERGNREKNSRRCKSLDKGKIKGQDLERPKSFEFVCVTSDDRGKGFTIPLKKITPRPIVCSKMKTRGAEKSSFLGMVLGVD